MARDGGRTGAAGGIAARRVLVVDDHAFHRDLERVLLESLGCAVAEAADGFEAVRAANEVPFDVIIMDRQMPACDGDQAALLIRAFRGLRRDAVIVCCSSEPPSGSAAALYDDVLAKPATAGGMQAMLERISLRPGVCEVGHDEAADAELVAAMGDRRRRAQARR